MCIKLCGFIFRVFDWYKKLWGIKFRGHGSVVGTIIVGLALSILVIVDLFLWIRGIPQFIHLENF